MDWVLNAGTHLPLQRLLKQQAVLELDALTNADKTFLIESLLLWIHHHRMNEPGREELKHVLLIEEAHHVLLKKKQELTGAEAVTDVILREVREFGQAIVLLDQLPSLISKPALENSYTTICMNLKEKGDVTAAAKAMLLESDDARYLGRLDVGWGIVRLQARWPKPFLIRFPLFAVRKGVVNDQQVTERFLDHLDAETVARTMRDGIRAIERLVDGPPTRTAHSMQAVTGLDEEDRLLLRDVADHPFSPVTERYVRFQLNPKRGTSLTARLIDHGLLRSVNVPVPGSHLRLLELTSTGRQTLGLAPEQTDRHGGLEHRYWVERIAGELKDAGLSAEKEVSLGSGRTVDLHATIAGKRIAVEVETGKSDWMANVRKCLETGIDRVVVAPTRRSLRVAMLLALQSSVRRDHVAVVHASQVARHLIDESRDPRP